MAEILTFRHRKDVQTPQTFLQDGGDTLPFLTTPEGRTDLGTVEIPSPPAATNRDWSNQELADLFRVKRLLDAAGVPCGTDRGLTDEGDPWFVFCDADGEVFIHLCRIDGLYVLDSPNIRKPLRGADFNALIADFTNRSVPRAPSSGGGAPAERRVVRLERGGKVFLHPSVLLAALIWSLLVASDDLVLLSPEAEAPGTDGLDALRLLDADAILAADGDPDGHGHREAAPDPTLPVTLPVSDTVDTLLPETPARAGSPRDALLEARLEMQLKEAHQGLGIWQNSYALGLSTIAIAMGILSESILVDDRQKILGALEIIDLGQDQGADAGIVAQGEDDPLLALLHEIGTFLDTVGSAVHVETAGQEARAEDTTGPAADALADAPEITLSAEAMALAEPDSPHPPLSGANAPGQTAAPPDGLVLTLSTVGETDTAAAAQGSGGGPAPETSAVLADLLRSFQPTLQAFMLGDTPVQATFNPNAAAYREIGIVELVTEAEAGSADAGASPGAQHDLPEFDDRARALVDHLMSKSGHVDMISLDREIILIDPSVIAGDAADTYVRSWELGDDVIISVIGLRSEFHDFDLLPTA